MNFLSNLYNSAKSAISSVGQQISDTYSGLTASIGNYQQPTATMTPFQKATQNVPSTGYGMTKAPSKTGAIPMTAAPNSGYINTPQGAIKQTMFTATGDQIPQNMTVAPAPVYTPTVRPATPSINAVPTGSATLSGIADFLNNNPGASGADLQAYYASIPGLKGTAGEAFSPSTFSGGGQTFTGGLSSSTPGFGGGSFNGATSGAGTVGNGVNTTNPDEALNGKKKKAGGAVITQPKPFNALNVPAVPSEINAQSLLDYKKANEGILSSPQALSSDDKAQLQSNLEQAIQAGMVKVNALKGETPTAPVIDTEEQMKFLEGLQPHEQITAKQAMDDIRNKLGLPAIEGQRLDTLKQIQATNEGFQTIFDDIKNNPNLPKGLAQRRLTELQNQQKTRIMQLTNQLDIYNQQISDANNVVNREFQIFQSDQAEQNRQANNKLEIARFLISNAKYMSPEDIKVSSEKYGIPAGLLKSAGKSKENIDAKFDPSTGNLIGVDENGKTVWRNTDFKNAPKASSGSTGYSPEQNRSLTQAGISGLDSNTKNFFINTPSKFQDYVAQGKAAGTIKVSDVTSLKKLYDSWNSSQSLDKMFESLLQ